jgi:FO synthase subunit 1
LAPVRDLLDCGVDDLGGVSPVTDHHINPNYAWPALRELEDIAGEADIPPPRAPPRPRAVPRRRLERVRAAINADDEAGERYRSVLYF